MGSQSRADPRVVKGTAFASRTIPQASRLDSFGARHDQGPASRDPVPATHPVALSGIQGG